MANQKRIRREGEISWIEETRKVRKVKEVKGRETLKAVRGWWEVENYLLN